MNKVIKIAISSKSGKEEFYDLFLPDQKLDSFFENAELLTTEKKLEELSSFLKSKSYLFRREFIRTLKIDGPKISVNIPKPNLNPKPVKPVKPVVKKIKPVRRFPTRNDIAVITCFFNPLNFNSSKRNYHRFARQLSEQNIPLYTCEAIFDGQQPEITYGNVIHVKADSILFIKENLLNIAEKIVPKKYTKIIFMDCDFLFSEPDWAWEASSILDKKPAAQCMRHILDLDENGKVRHRTHSMGFSIKEGRPGGGWAVHRELFTHFGGLYDKMITGGGDMVHTWGGFLGQMDENFFWINQYNESYQDSWRKWCKPVFRYVRGDIGVLQIDVAHLFHGTRQNRKYTARSACVLDVEPEKHLIYNEDGVITWNLETAPKHAVLCMNNYFKNRQEDVGEKGGTETIDPEQINWDDSWL